MKKPRSDCRIYSPVSYYKNQIENIPFPPGEERERLACDTCNARDVFRRSALKLPIVLALTAEEHTHIAKNSLVGTGVLKELLLEEDHPQFKENVAKIQIVIEKNMHTLDALPTSSLPLAQLMNEYEKNSECITALLELYPIQIKPIYQWIEQLQNASANFQNKKCAKYGVVTRTQKHLTNVDALAAKQSADLAKARVTLEAYKTEKRKLTEAHLRLVMSRAMRYENCGIPMIDLISEGNLGLMEAIDRYDHRTKMGTYAPFWIQERIARFIDSNCTLLHFPMSAQVQSQRLHALINKYKANEKYPTIEHLADDMGTTTEQISILLRWGKKWKKYRSLDDCLPSDPSFVVDHDNIAFQERQRRIHDVLFLTEKNDAELTKQEIHDLVKELPDPDCRVIKLRFGLEEEGPYTLKEIGNKFGVTKERIRQIEARGIGKLRGLLGR